MPDRRFFAHAGPFSLSELAELCGVACDPADAGRSIARATPLSAADGECVAFFADKRYLEELKATSAAAVFVPAAFADMVPAGTAALVTPTPQALWSKCAERLHPVHTLDNSANLHPSAVLDENVYLGPNVVVGADVRIGRGTRISANSVIGPGVQIGRDCDIGANIYIGFALIGDRVRIASGSVIGEAGFGVAGSATGAVDVPQLGRVILQDGVTVGANCAIDRGAFSDTVVGENSKLDNFVQIAHNVTLGRNCAVAAHVGISGSTKVGDGVQFGGQAGIAPHLTIGDGAAVAGQAGVMKDIPAGETVAGFPAQPIRQWLREAAWLSKQSKARDKE